MLLPRQLEQHALGFRSQLLFPAGGSASVFCECLCSFRALGQRAHCSPHLHISHELSDLPMSLKPSGTKCGTGLWGVLQPASSAPDCGSPTALRHGSCFKNFLLFFNFSSFFYSVTLLQMLCWQLHTCIQCLLVILTHPPLTPTEPLHLPVVVPLVGESGGGGGGGGKMSLVRVAYMSMDFILFLFCCVLNGSLGSLIPS